jgi:hypothetical protein
MLMVVSSAASMNAGMIRSYLALLVHLYLLALTVIRIVLYRSITLQPPSQGETRGAYCGPLVGDVKHMSISPNHP